MVRVKGMVLDGALVLAQVQGVASASTHFMADAEACGTCVLVIAILAALHTSTPTLAFWATIHDFSTTSGSWPAPQVSVSELSPRGWCSMVRG